MLAIFPHTELLRGKQCLQFFRQRTSFSKVDSPALVAEMLLFAGRQDNGELNRGTSARRLSNTAVELADPSYTVVAGTPGEPSSARPQGHA